MYGGAIETQIDSEGNRRPCGIFGIAVKTDLATVSKALNEE